MNFARFTGVKNTFFKYSVPQQVSDQIRAKLEFLIFFCQKNRPIEEKSVLLNFDKFFCL